MASQSENEEGKKKQRDGEWEMSNGLAEVIMSGGWETRIGESWQRDQGKQIVKTTVSPRFLCPPTVTRAYVHMPFEYTP